MPGTVKLTTLSLSTAVEHVDLSGPIMKGGVSMCSHSTLSRLLNMIVLLIYQVIDLIFINFMFIKE